jgi:hypothetical protein
MGYCRWLDEDGNQTGIPSECVTAGAPLNTYPLGMWSEIEGDQQKRELIKWFLEKWRSKAEGSCRILTIGLDFASICLHSTDTWYPCSFSA